MTECQHDWKYDNTGNESKQFCKKCNMWVSQYSNETILSCIFCGLKTGYRND